MFDMVTTLISERKIPALDELQMEALLHHLFTATPKIDLEETWTRPARDSSWWMSAAD